MYKRAIEIFYSSEDGGYIAVVPELPGCYAFGETEEKARKGRWSPSSSGSKRRSERGEKFQSPWGEPSSLT